MTMNSDLCMALMRADTEDDVIAILREAGYWDDPSAWRLFSDNENSFSVIGNQQAEAIAAFVEKIVNSVDARLVDACRLAGIDPESPEAPDSMRKAVAQFFEGKSDPKPSDGRIAGWLNDNKATAEGRLLTVSATGHKPEAGQPSLTVADQGEGQTPDAFPDTFMSTQRNNKLRIPFVQGKFNMGGTGAFQFSKLQLIVSRRNPAFVSTTASERDHEWGFTIVRREPPTQGSKSSVYRYLAPVELPGEGLRGVLSFPAEAWPIFPEAAPGVRDAYYRESRYGSLVKLYEYTWQGTKSNIVQAGDGLLRRLDIGLPELALPVRLFECRPGYGGPGAHHGSFATNALGLVARLDRDRENNLEAGEPIGGVIALDDGKQIKLRVYVFQNKDKAKSYRTARHGVVFGVNGQMHAAYSTDFFTRSKVNLSYLKDSLLVFADCSEIDGQTREDLFMNSRDRLRVNPVSKQLEEKLESFMRTEPTLREIQNRRRQEATQERLKEDKPLGDVLQKLMRNNPILSRLLLDGLNLSTPFAPDGGASGNHEDFVGKRFPTYFRFRDRDSGESLTRPAHLDSRVRISFETDAEDTYFVRDSEPGVWRIRRRAGDGYEDATGWITTGPKSGIAQLWFDSLPDDATPGTTLEYLIEVTDPSRIDSFQIKLVLEVAAKREGASEPGKPRNNANNGKGRHGGNDSSVAMPDITLVKKEKWPEYDFTDTGALKIVHAGPPDNDAAPIYDFFVNVDNKYLLHSYKQSAVDTALLEKQFVYGLVLVGLALLQDHHKKPVTDDEEGERIEETVRRVTTALGAILLPMIQTIGGLDATLAAA
ncbi:MAG: hypothetical protein QOI62_1234 [Solirubrobacteraceae bacterium]|jgi:hypothetical protein|nr:hypothetical protein [Solirubrobacteraceae bacterium]